MNLEKSKVMAAIKKSQAFLLDGIDNHLLTNKQKQRKFLINPCPLATALVILVSRKNSRQKKKAITWLRKIQNKDGGWGIAENVPSDINSTSLCLLAIEDTGKQAEERARMFIEENGGFLKTEWAVQVILSLFDKYPPDKISIPGIGPLKMPPAELRFTPSFYRSLHPYVKDMFFSLTALEVLEKRGNADKILRFLESVQGLDGSWKQDVITTSMAALAFQKAKINPGLNPYKWFSGVQYSDGAFPAFNQMSCWDIGWASSILSKRFLQDERLHRAREYLENGMYLDGSFGMTLPHAVPDIDDTAVALSGLRSLGSEKTSRTVKYLRSMQNKDGSWSTFPEYYGSPPYCVSGEDVHLPSVDITCHVLKALYDEQAGDEEFIKSALNWLGSAQNKDGSWETTWFNSKIYATSEAITTLRKFGTKGKTIFRGLAWLCGQQHSDGSFGNGTAEETSSALAAFLTCSINKVDINPGILYLMDKQNPDGSFIPSYSGVYALSLYYNDPMYSAYLGLNALELYNKML